MICAIILAAGRSRRMGTQKLLLPLGRKAVIAHVADAVLQSPVGRTLVVVGPHDVHIRQALDGRAVEFVPNPDAEGDMLSSLRCALRLLPEACAAVLAVLGDQPGLTPALVSRLVEAFQTCGGGIVVPTHQGRRGHPIVFSARYLQELLTSHDRIGLRGLLRDHAHAVVEVQSDDSSVLEDLDTPAAYRAAIRSRRW